MKIVALVGILAALVLGAASMLLRRSQSSPAAAAAPTTPIRHFTPKPGTPAARLAARSHAKTAAPRATTAPSSTTAAPGKAAPAAPAPAAQSTVAAQPAVAPAVPAAPKPKAKPKPKPPVAANGLPTPLDELLHTHKIVVVAVYDPEVASERTIALPEARAGALDAGAGFLAVNVLDERVAGPLTAVAGNGTILPDPGILVYRQPMSLINVISGFADREAVVEAVANALMAPAPVVTPAAPATTPAAPSVAPVTTP
jgi:hypothetical protein